MKKRYVTLTVLLLTSNMYGMDGIEFLEKDQWIESVSVSPTNLTVKFQLGPSRSFFSVRPTGLQGDWRDAKDYIANDEALVLTPDRTAWLGGRDYKIMFTPVSFKKQHKGFRVTWLPEGDAAYSTSPKIAYIALGDTPMALGEGDVEMVMDDGEWVKAEESRSLEIEKLGWRAENMIRFADLTMQRPDAKASLRSNPEGSELWNLLVDKGFIKHPKLTPLLGEDRVISPRMKRLFAWDWEHGLIDSNEMARILGDPDLVRIWNAAVAEGLIKTNAADAQDGTKPPPALEGESPRKLESSGGLQPPGPTDTIPPITGNRHRLWFYAVIPLGLLAVLYFIRRKSKN